MLRNALSPIIVQATLDVGGTILMAAALLQMGGTVFDLARTVHAHPTLSEVFLEAAAVATQPPKA